jgi:hypothetical protein
MPIPSEGTTFAQNQYNLKIELRAKLGQLSEIKASGANCEK